MIAGQPPEYYSEEYPTWLTTNHLKVRRIDLPKLELDDIKCLLIESTTSIDQNQINEAVRLIDELSQGNTLSVVFAVAEAELCNSLEQLATRLKERRLGDGLSQYYDSIWRHALRDTNELSCSLAGAISLARVATKLAWPFWGELKRESPRIETDAFFAFEKGCVDEITTSPSVESLDELIAQHEPRFFANFELAIRNLAKANSWKLVAEFLDSIEDQRKSLTGEFLLEASWYALKAGISAESEWVFDTDDLKSNLPRIPKHYLGEDINLTQFINAARTVGWKNTSLDTGDIADLIFQTFETPDEESVTNAMTLLFRTAAVVGRIEGQVARSDWDSAGQLFTPSYIRQLLCALWDDVINRAHYRFKGRLESSALAEKLTQFCKELGGKFDKVALEAALPFAEEHVLGSRLKCDLGSH